MIEHTVRVGGEAEQEVVPDLATWSFEVLARGHTSTEDTLRACAEVRQRLLEELDPAEPGCATAGAVAVSEEIEWGEGGARRPVGFLARAYGRGEAPVERAGRLAGVIAGLGAILSGPAYSVSDERAIRDKLQADSVREAARRAEILAVAAGRTLGRAVHVTDQDSGRVPGPVPRSTFALAAAGEPPVSVDLVPEPVVLREAVVVGFELVG